MAIEYYEVASVVDTMYTNLLNQYKESSNLVNYITALLDPFVELEQIFADILNLRLFENATYSQLEGVGALVGQNRGVYDTSDILYFGMDADNGTDPVPHLGFGDFNDPSTGGYFRSIGQPTSGKSYLDDFDYHLFITAKIHRNHYPGGEEELISIIHDVLRLDISAGETVHIIEDFTLATDPFVTVKINKILSTKEKSFLTLTEILPRPAGIRYIYEDAIGGF